MHKQIVHGFMALYTFFVTYIISKHKATFNNRGRRLTDGCSRSFVQWRWERHRWENRLTRGRLDARWQRHRLPTSPIIVLHLLLGKLEFEVRSKSNGWFGDRIERLGWQRARRHCRAEQEARVAKQDGFRRNWQRWKYIQHNAYTMQLYRILAKIVQLQDNTCCKNYLWLTADTSTGV